MKRSSSHHMIMQKGASLVEYALLTTFIVLTSLASIQVVGWQLSDKYALLAERLGGGTEQGAPGPSDR